MDSASGLCLGCLRTIDEITLWSRADESTRINILAAVARRREPLQSKPQFECDRND
jgi:predicted Fe-S protein YdhL (DUF1289 family)